MKYQSEYRNKEVMTKLVDLIAKETTRQHTIMEICGGQTHAILKYGLDQLLPASIRLLHGPGCPVCVTPSAVIDAAIQIAQRPEVIFCSFGDMLRVPGSTESLLSARAKGANVRIVYSPLDAVKLAQRVPQSQVVFFAIGFETTAPANALALAMAEQLKLENFSLLIAQFLVPPAMAAILAATDNKVQAFLAAGHVCTVMGTNEYAPLCKKYQVPIVVTGFEPCDILHGIYCCVKQLEHQQFVLENQYARVVTKQGNQTAQALLATYFTVANKEWRGIGMLPNSGLSLRAQYSQFDALEKFKLNLAQLNSDTADKACIAGLILTGSKKPTDCQAFATSCCPEQPLGAPMVSVEGVCAAYYNYRNIMTTRTT